MFLPRKSPAASNKQDMWFQTGKNELHLTDANEPSGPHMLPSRVDQGQRGYVSRCSAPIARR